MIYEFIRHRGELSAAAGRQVENDEAMVTFLSDVLEGLPDERTLMDGGASDEEIWRSTGRSGSR